MGKGLKIGRKLVVIRKRRNDDASINITYFGYADDYPNKKKMKRNNGGGDQSSGRKKLLKKGDFVKISDILQDIPFLITNNNQLVHPQHLEGKVIVLYFVPLVPPTHILMLYLTTLVDIYHSLQQHSSKSPFEVVFIGVKVTEQRCMSFRPIPDSSLEMCFQHLFSLMPWPAIPFQHINTPRYWGTRLSYPIHKCVSDILPFSLVFDSTGILLRVGAENIFRAFGAEAYPFTNKRIRYLQCQDEKAANSTSITKLLTSHGLKHVINNEDEMVPVKDLEGKVVALYFYEDIDFDNFEKKLKKAYDKLVVEMKENFEIVLVYLHDTVDAFKCSSETSFQRAICRMPWLALPYKDPRCKNLQRIFKYPCDLESPGPDPRLVIIGPHGEYIEPYGADIFKLFQYPTPGAATLAYPFTRGKVAELDVEILKTLRLEEMFRDSNISFKRANGPKVQLSQLVGKKIMLIIEDGWPVSCPRFWSRLEKRYVLLKEKGDPFEVIHVPHTSAGSSENVSTRPWLTCPPFPKESGKSDFKHHRVFRGGTGLLAFDADGKVVRRTILPRIKKGNECFPFYDGGLEKEALSDLEVYLDWPYVLA